LIGSEAQKPTSSLPVFRQSREQARINSAKEVVAIITILKGIAGTIFIECQTTQADMTISVIDMASR
jgi:hypothetical protein